MNSGQSASLNVQFDPTVTGAATGQLTIASNSSTNGSAVVSLSGTGAPHEVDLSWTTPAAGTDPVAGYNVYRSAQGANSYSLLSSPGESETAYMDTTAQSALSYDYVVKSFDGSGNESAASNMTSVTIP
jgi:fibronectin type 3 domain-containing protein